MKQLVLFYIFITMCLCGHIYHWENKLDFNYEGEVRQITMYIKLENGLGPQDYIQLEWPESLGTNTQCRASIYIFESNVRIGNKIIADAGSVDPIYYFNFGSELQKDQWLKLIIETDVTLTPNTVYTTPIQMQTVSSTTANKIIYDQNLSMGRIYIPSNLGATSLGVTVNPVSGVVVQNDPLAQYYIDIQISPSIQIDEGGYYYIEIKKNGNSDGSSDGQDYKFTGSCFSVHSSNILPVASKCNVLDDLTTIKFYYPGTINQNDDFTVRVKIVNPEFVSTRDIQVYAISKRDNIPIERGIDAGCLSVTSINIIRGKFKYLWGISTDETGTSTIPIAPFKALNGGIMGPLNSIYIGFKTAKVIPQGTEYILKVKIQATGVLESTFLTNIPSNNDNEVQCSYDGTIITCVNIGALVSTEKEYFIAVKAFWAHDATDPTDYGEIVIESVAYDEDDQQISGVTLFNSLAGVGVTLEQNSEFLDSASGGWHDTDTFSFGTTQVLSYYDDGTLSATPKGMGGILSDDVLVKNRVGIFPRDSIDLDQQLIFFMKVDPTESFPDDGTDQVSKMEVLFNSEVIQLRQGYETLGIDYAAWHIPVNGDGYTGDEHRLQGMPCFQDETEIHCNQYDKVNTTKNVISYADESDDTKPYGLIEFECGFYDNSSNLPQTKCDHFQGQGTFQKGEQGAFAIRHIQFDSDFHSSIYPDQDVMDFVITFSQATHDGSSLGAYTKTVSTLINAYTLENVALSNIKASYVNFYGHASTVNEGQQIPMLLRIGGTVLQQEHQNATKMGIFVDQYIDSLSFYEQDNVDYNYEIGCSSGKCEFFGGENIANFQTESWLTSKTYIASDLPNLENEYNILIPCLNTAGQQPESINIAFFAPDHQAYDVPNKLKTLSVYRVFGPTIEGTIEQPLTKINGLADNGDTTLDFTADWTETGSDDFAYEIDTTKISPQGSQDTLIRSSSSVLTQNAGQVVLGQPVKYGGGFTITSLFYDIFTFASVSFFDPPAGYQDCTKFSYVKNSAEPTLTGKRIYTVFCPMDYTFDLSSSFADIQITNPSYPGNFVESYPLEPLLHYGLSDDTGTFLGFKIDAQILPASQNPCISQEFIGTIYEESSGKQKIIIPIQIPSDLTFDGDSLIGFSEIKIVVTYSESLAQIEYDDSICEILNLDTDLFSCTYSETNANDEYTFILSIQTGNQYTISEFTDIQFGIYVSTLGNGALPTDQVTYTMEVFLPTYDSGNTKDVLFGDAYESTNPAKYCTTDAGEIHLSSVPLGTQMSINSLSFQFLEMDARGQFQFLFKSVSQRDIFFATSNYVIDFGFLQNNNDDLLANNGFRCLVYEDNDTISWKWKEIDFSDFTAISISPKEDIMTPDQYQFIFKCEGGSTPINSGGVEGDDLNCAWVDEWDGSPVNLQETTVNIDYPTSTIITDNKAFATTPTLEVKQFNTQGYEAFYTFKLKSIVALTQASRVYVQFSNAIPVGLNKDGQPECYLKLTVDGDSSQSFCELVGERMVSVWVNLAISANTFFYLDILQVAQPEQSLIDGTNHKIWIGIDDDNDTNNGISEFGVLADTQPEATATSAFEITEIVFTNDKVLSTHDITFKIDFAADTVVAGEKIYIDLTREITNTVSKGQTAQCYLMNLITNTDFASSCTFISQKRLEVVLELDPLNDHPKSYKFILKNMPTPQQIPDGARIYQKFDMFMCDQSDNGLPILKQSYQYRQNFLIYEKEENLIDLVWNFYQPFKDNNNQIDEEFIGQGESEIYIGYYKRNLELTSSDNSKFKTDFEFQFLNSDTFAFNIQVFKISTGTQGTKFSIAAKQTTESGVYSLQCEKTVGDPLQEYTNIPPLRLIVRDQPCQINTQDQQYYVPIGGKSIPIILDYFNCFPTDDISLSVSFDSNGAVLSEGFQDGTVNADSIDTRVIFQVESTTTTTENQTVIATFSITGTNSDSFVVPDPIQIIFVTPTTGAYTLQPIAQSLSGGDAPVVNQNTVNMVLQCDQPSIIYWALGVDDSIVDMEINDIKKFVVINGRFHPLIEHPDDHFLGRIYGSEISSISIPINLELEGLRSASDYKIKYYCENQLSYASKPIIGSWSIPNNGGYLLKLTIWVEEILTYKQLNDVSCALSKQFQIDADRIFTERANTCGNVSAIMGRDQTVDHEFEKQQENGLYPYSYYFLPDYTLASDTTNLLVKEETIQKGFENKLIQKLSYPLNFPSILDFETEDGIKQIQPSVEILSVTRDYYRLTVKTKISEVKGYTFVGIFKGQYKEDSMGTPTLDNMKLGIYDSENDLSFYDIQVAFTGKDVETEFLFKKLDVDEEYTIMVGASNDDPSHLAYTSEIKYEKYATLPVDELYYADESRLKFNYILTILLVILLGFIFE